MIKVENKEIGMNADNKKFSHENEYVRIFDSAKDNMN